MRLGPREPAQATPRMMVVPRGQPLTPGRAGPPLAPPLTPTGASQGAQQYTCYGVASGSRVASGVLAPPPPGHQHPHPVPAFTTLSTRCLKLVKEKRSLALPQHGPRRQKTPYAPPGTLVRRAGKSSAQASQNSAIPGDRGPEAVCVFGGWGLGRAAAAPPSPCPGLLSTSRTESAPSIRPPVLSSCSPLRLPLSRSLYSGALSLPSPCPQGLWKIEASARKMQKPL